MTKTSVYLLLIQKDADFSAGLAENDSVIQFKITH